MSVRDESRGGEDSTGWFPGVENGRTPSVGCGMVIEGFGTTVEPHVDFGGRRVAVLGG